MTDFDGHTDSDFWLGRMGRLGVSGDCSVIAPAFIVGNLYVVLMGVAPDTKQYEQIASSKDAWLRLVEQTLTESGK